MKITLKQLRKLIKEETHRALSEGFMGRREPDEDGDLELQPKSVIKYIGLRDGKHYYEVVKDTYHPGEGTGLQAGQQGWLVHIGDDPVPSQGEEITLTKGTTLSGVTLT